MKSYRVLDVNVSAVNIDLASAYIRDMVRDRQKGYVCVAPVATIVDARRDPAYRAVVNAAAMVTPDGMPVVWLGRLKGHKQVQRTYGPDLMVKVCQMGQSFGLRHFFYGGTEDVCDKLERSLKARFPQMVVAGRSAPSFVKEAVPLTRGDIDKINAARPDVLWVALGSPKQDFWMALNRSSFDVPVMVGVGAAFDFLAGAKPQAPLWMQRSGLEWVFRLCSEPKRLWKRYAIGNTLFIWWLVKEELLKKR